MLLVIHLVPPNAKVQEHTKLVPGTDGEKMSKSRDNVINIFLPRQKITKANNVYQNR